MNDAKAPRILLVAHHANPSWGSEPLIGWRWAVGLAARTEVTLVTHIRNRPAIDAAGGFAGDVHYVNTERVARAVNWINDRIWGARPLLNRGLLEFVALRMFDRAACRIARRLARAGAVDVIHRVSPISPRHPTRLGTCGLPFLLGPLNGGMELPPGFDTIARHERAGWHILRRLSRLADPAHITFATADRIFSASRAAMAVVPRRHHVKTERLCENAVVLDAFRPCYKRQAAGLRVLFLGRLIPLKGVDRLIDAIGLLRSRGLDVLLDIVGDGDECSRLERRAARAGLGGVITFCGALPVDAVSGHLERCDVLCLPCVRESGGAVLLEAMAAGKPVVAVDHGGPAETVPAACGVLVSPTPADTLDDRLSRVLERLAVNEPERERMGRAARRHVEASHTWSDRVDTVMEAYERVLAPAGPRMSRAMPA